MKQSKLRIYLDTSVISYHAARMHRDPVIRSRQMTTKRWWEAFQDKAEFFVSSYVLEEIMDGDAEAAKRRLDLVKGISKIASDRYSERLGERLLRSLNIPMRSSPDAYHLAIAALNGQNYIVSWNFKHMANVRIQNAYETLCREMGLSAPKILTPAAMLERREP